MLLQPTIPKPSPNYPKQNVSASNALSFSSGLLQNSTFFLKKSILYTTGYKTHEENAVFVTCSSTPRGTVDYGKRALLNWSDVYKKLYMLKKSDSGAAAVLSRIENEGKKITKWELSKVVKELRKLKRFKLALEIYEWMNNMPQRFRTTSATLPSSSTSLRKCTAFRAPNNTSKIFQSPQWTIEYMAPF
uniref:Putative chloroplast n=1 Tax=Ixodes ricinus TaxID=34613 RepID=A0A0K8RGQ7_IXORI